MVYKTVVADTQQTTMLILLYLLVAVLSLGQVEGKKGCWADATAPGDECLYGWEVPGGSDFGIHYIFTSKFSRICCQALECKPRGKCSFKDVWCGQSVSGIAIKADVLRWGQTEVEPAMRCYDAIGYGAYYSYTVQIVTID